MALAFCGPLLAEAWSEQFGVLVLELRSSGPLWAEYALTNTNPKLTN
jgi:hypothetical protein